MTKPNACTVIATAVPMAIALNSATYAQDGNPIMLEEVIVTAQKREQSLQDVPISIVAFDSEKLDVMGIQEIEDIGINVPNLIINSFNNNANAVRLFIRGIGQNDVQLTQDPSVALYIDGVYVGTSIGSGLDTVDIQRIEILRGPQGTLYGRNATGGALNILSKRPNIEEFEINQSVDVGNFGLLKSRTSINLPIADRAAIKLGYLYSDRDGFVENKGPGDDWAAENRNAWRADIRIAATDAFTVDYSYDNSDIQDTPRLEQIRTFDPNNPTIGALGGVLTTPASKSRLDDAVAARSNGDQQGLEVEGHNLTLTWELGEDLTVKSISAVREVDSTTFTDGSVTLSLTGIPGDASINSPNAMTKFEQFSQELQLVGTAFNESLEFATGIYYYDDDAEQTTMGEQVFPLLQASTTSANTSLAVYSELTYTPPVVDNKLHVTLGARYSDDEREAFRINDNSATFAALGGAVETGAPYKNDFQNFNPSFGLAYDLGDDVNVYAKYVSGFKSGGTSQRSANPINFGNGFDEEEVTSVELGLKGTFFDSRVRFNAAVFSTDIDGFQASVQTGATQGDRDFVPIDGVEIDGLEMDMVVALTGQLEMTASYGFLDTSLGTAELATLDSDGNRLTTILVDEVPYTANNSYTLALDYVADMRFGDLSIHVGYAFQEGVAATSLNVSDNAPLDDRGLIDANIGIRNIELGQGALTVSMWGKNITDQDYRLIDSASFTQLGISSLATFGDPRTYGLTVSYEY